MKLTNKQRETLLIECAAYLGSIGAFNVNDTYRLSQEVISAYQSVGNPIANYINDNDIIDVREAIALNYPYINH